MRPSATLHRHESRRDIDIHSLQSADKKNSLFRFTSSQYYYYFMYLSIMPCRLALAARQSSVITVGCAVLCTQRRSIALHRTAPLRDDAPSSTSAPAAADLSPPAAALISETDQAILKLPYKVIETPEAFSDAMRELSRSSSVSLDIEAFCTSGKERQLGTISLLQACSATTPVVYLFDVLTLTKPTFIAGIRPLLESTAITKLFFDCRRDVEALSCQMGVKPAKVLDLQLQFTALQWKLKSNSRRSGMTYVLKSLARIERQYTDSAVQTAMTCGGRAVWDVRPLPAHFLEYAADDVRHICLLEAHLRQRCDEMKIPVGSVERLTGSYVDSYAIGQPVTSEPDSRPAEVNASLLERYIGPGGSCAFCGARGHTEAECFKKEQGKASTVRCTFCGQAGHTVGNCFNKNPQVLKCDLCGQIGHSADRCFKKNPCKHCGGQHSAANCHKYLRDISFFDTGKPERS